MDSIHLWRDLHLGSIKRFILVKNCLLQNNSIRMLDFHFSHLRGGSDRELTNVTDFSSLHVGIDLLGNRSSYREQADERSDDQGPCVTSNSRRNPKHIRFTGSGEAIKANPMPVLNSGVNDDNTSTIPVQTRPHSRKRKRDPADITQREWTTLCNPLTEEWISLLNHSAQNSRQSAKSDIRPKPRETITSSRGNYSGYYWRRAAGGVLRSVAPGVWNDARLELLCADWFTGQHCLDIGCNAGLFTMSVAYKFRSCDPFLSPIRFSCRRLDSNNRARRACTESGLGLNQQSI